MTGRRASLPGAAELFRSTRAPTEREPEPAPPAARTEPAPPEAAEPEPAEPEREQPSEPADPRPRKGTGRERHSSKITVYLSDEELLALERARLTLRAEHGRPVDRGRIVREAIAVLLEDFDTGGTDSLLVRRLDAEPGP